MKTYTCAKASRKGRFRRYAAMSLCFALGGALLAVASSVNSRAAGTAGGFLYSDYVGSPGLSLTPDYFRVSSPRALLLTDGGRISERLDETISGLPLSDWILDDVSGVSDISPRIRDYAVQSGWDFTRAGIEDGVLALSEGALSGGSIRKVDFDISSELGGRIANVGINVIGALRDNDYDAVAWQLRGYKGNGSRQGFNIGGAYRWASNNAMFGANLYADYGTFDNEGIWRGSFGGEMRSGWLDVFANYYFPISEVERDDEVLWTQGGYDLELNLHSPDNLWLTGILGYYFWDGKNGEYVVEDEEGFRFGLKFSPSQAPVVLEALYQTNKDEDDTTFGGKLMFFHEFGNQRVTGSSVREFRPQDWFFTAAEREYTQRFQVSSRDNLWVVQSLMNTTPGNVVRVMGILDSLVTRAELQNIRDGLGLNIQGQLSGETVETTRYGLPWQIPAFPATVGVIGDASDEVRISLTYSHGRVHVGGQNFPGTTDDGRLSLELGDNQVVMESGMASLRGSDFAAIVGVATTAISAQILEANIEMSQNTEVGAMMDIDGRVLLEAGSIMVDSRSSGGVFTVFHDSTGSSVVLMSGSIETRVGTNTVLLSCNNVRGFENVMPPSGVHLGCSNFGVEFEANVEYGAGDSNLNLVEVGDFGLSLSHTGSVDVQTELAVLRVVGGTGVLPTLSVIITASGITVNTTTGVLYAKAEAGDILDERTTLVVGVTDNGETRNIVVAMDITRDLRATMSLGIVITSKVSSDLNNVGRGFHITSPWQVYADDAGSGFAGISTGDSGEPEELDPRTYSFVSTGGLAFDTTTQDLSIRPLPTVDTMYSAEVTVETRLATVVSTIYVEVIVPLEYTLNPLLTCNNAVGCGTNTNPYVIVDVPAARGGAVLASLSGFQGGSGAYTVSTPSGSPIEVSSNNEITLSSGVLPNEALTTIISAEVLIRSGRQSVTATLYFEARILPTFVFVPSTLPRESYSFPEYEEGAILTLDITANGGSCTGGASYSVGRCIEISGGTTTTVSGACSGYSFDASELELTLQSGVTLTTETTYIHEIEATCSDGDGATLGATLRLTTEAEDRYLVRAQLPTLRVSESLWDGIPFLVGGVSTGGGNCFNPHADTTYEVMCSETATGADCNADTLFRIDKLGLESGNTRGGAAIVKYGVDEKGLTEVDLTIRGTCGRDAREVDSTTVKIFIMR